VAQCPWFFKSLFDKKNLMNQITKRAEMIINDTRKATIFALDLPIYLNCFRHNILPIQNVLDDLSPFF
jgi:hypothetical protein